MHRLWEARRQESLFRQVILESGRVKAVLTASAALADHSCMPSIDLARLRKQAARLTDFFLVPDEFTRQLNEVLDSYVDYTVRRGPALAPGMNLRSYRTPTAVLKQIEQQLFPLASRAESADVALDLADRLWDEAWLETRLLAAFLLGSIAPRERHLIARLTAWTSQDHDLALRSKLLDSSLVRMRKEAPSAFLTLIGEWLQPERSRLWPDALQAAISAIADPDFINLPPLLEVLQPVVKAAPSQIQGELEQLVLALYQASPTETTYFIRELLITSDNPMTAVTFRRMSPSFPPDLAEEIREFVRGKPFSVP
jgi:hypothetical protein